MPSLSAPQDGSTAQAGGEGEGIFFSDDGYTFITSTGKLARKDFDAWVFGSITTTGLNWSINSGTHWLSGGQVPRMLSGSGTFVSKATMDGTYTKSGSSVADDWGPLNYSPSNALAVKQDSVAGTWSTVGSRILSNGIEMSIDVDADGALSGSTSGFVTGTCKVSGTISLAQPETSKNLYELKFSATDAATGTQRRCTLGTLQPYEGLSAIVLAPAGTWESNGYYRYLGFNAKTSFNEMFTIFLRKKV